MNTFIKLIIITMIMVACLQIGIHHGRGLEREEAVGGDMYMCEMNHNCDDDFQQ